IRSPWRCRIGETAPRTRRISWSITATTNEQDRQRLMSQRMRYSASLLACCALLAVTAATVPARAQPAVCVENASIGELRDALLAGRVTSAELTRAYLARIAAYDRAGPMLNAVREVNPDALTIAEKLDAAKPDPRLLLWGIPVLIKDNIATGDSQHTTAGSLALADAHARRDATVAALLRRAGAVILGKANLTEF